MPFSLGATVQSHGWYEIPPFSWDVSRGVLTVAVPAPRGGVWSCRMWQSGAGQGSRLYLRWDSPTGAPRGRRARRAARALARRVLNLDWDLRPFHALCAQHPPLGWVPRAGAGRLLRGPSVFSDVVSAICGTNVQWKQAVRMVHRVCDGAPRARPGDPPRFPTPGEVRAGGMALLRTHARLGYRAASVLRLTDAVLEQGLDLEGLVCNAPDGDALRRRLAGLPGIGPVTARYLATLYGYADALAVDSLVRAFVGDRYFGGRRPAPREVEAIYARFGDWRALAYWFEFLGTVDPVTWRGWERGGASPEDVG